VDEAINSRNESLNDGEKLKPINVQEQIGLIIQSLKVNGKTKLAEEIQQKLDGNQPPLTLLLDEVGGITGLIGIDFKKEFLEQLPHDNESMGDFAKNLVDQAIGRVLSFIGVYGLTSLGLGKALTMGQKQDDKKKKKDDELAMQSDPIVDFFEQLIFIALGTWAGHGFGSKMNLGKNGIRAAMAFGAALGFGAAELMSNGFRFIYNKFRAMLPEDKKDSLVIKTGFQLAMVSLGAFLIYTKGVLGKFWKFSAAMKDPSMRPTSNLIAGGLMTPSNWLVDTASIFTVPKYKAGFTQTTFGIRAPEGENLAEQMGNVIVNSGKSPYKTIINSIEDNQTKIEEIKKHNPLVGNVIGLLTRISDVFAGFPLVQQMAEHEEFKGDAVLPLNLEYFARGTGDIVIKLFNKVIICGIGSVLGFPLLYLYNLIKSKFKKDDDKKAEVTSPEPA
ncbi:MAG: hypothetical protein SFU25_01010, partial [Candidatus Caenarcaniphilales bacterium]|nr:hypothetical protein [Candidatus Caenarcaniphilales bacterium]